MNTMLMIIIIFSSHLLMTTIPTPAFSAATSDTTGDHYLDSICSVTSGFYTPGKNNYSQSLTYLVDDLCANAPESPYNGFRNASWAEDPTNRTYGLALCRGDVSMDDCKTCLINATIVVANTDCPYKRGAIIWRDHCMLKYSNKPFFGQIDNDTVFYSFNDVYVSSSWNGTFANTTQGLLDGLVDKAAAVPLMFANGTITNGNEAVYAMVQCTRDLSVGNCTTCLHGAIKDLSKLFGRRGGRVLSGSCMTRYEIYPFLE